MPNGIGSISPHILLLPLLSLSVGSSLQGMKSFQVDSGQALMIAQPVWQPEKR